MQSMEPRASSESRTSLSQASEARESRESREFEEREDWDPAPEEEFLRDTIEIVGANDVDHEDDDVSWA
jgi:hypothetical protein